MAYKDFSDISVGGTIAKIAFGLMFIAVSIFPGDEPLEAGAVAVGIILGLALVAWGVVPYIIAWNSMKKSEKKIQQIEDDRRAEEEWQRKQIERAENAPHHCPNCGANAHGRECEYCGAPLNE